MNAYYEPKLYHVVTVSLEPLIMSREQKGTKTKRNSVLHIDQGTGAPNEDIVQNHLT